MVVVFVNELREVWSRQKRNWRTVVTRQIFHRFFNEMTLQYANIYITLLGASPVQLGIVNSMLGVAQSLISIPLGIIRDRFNLKKIYLFGVAMLILVPLLYALAPGWQVIIIAVLISGLGTMIGSCVVICDLSLPPRDRATGKALCEGVGALPTILAPTVSAIIITLLGGISIRSVSALYWIQFAAMILLFIYVWRNLSDIERPNNAPKRLNVLKEYEEVFTRGIAVKRWLLFQAVHFFAMTMMLTFQYPYIYEVKGATQFIIGGAATAMLIAEVLFSTVFGRFADKVGRKKAFYLLIPLFTAANITLILSSNPLWIIASGFLLGFRTIASVIYGSMTPELVPPEYIGRWRGLIGLFTGLASIPAPIIGGYIWEHLGPDWILISIILVELLVQTPLIYSMPETLKKQA